MQFYNFGTVALFAGSTTVSAMPAPQKGITTAPVSALAEDLPIDGLFSLLDNGVIRTSPTTHELTPSDLGLPNQPLR
ncbi:hypothetical protein CROQUDRAFT_95077 [Cronartium quercuum f. sp. fusiforme G11]|uniref:Uncharacterized protein n=1 Tax=Cronartium quercuum f. sp. fusiforme G11 TaxID=708437 RepID=A0A9P6NEZ2_9BASI|nr:hypothetical protein CROQUDRAFT_95077 [Cronartium quercuum f. sp. fusiforme G11]